MSGGGNVVPLGTAGQTAVLPCGPVIFNAATTLQMQIATATAGTGYDQLSVTGPVSLGSATLTLQLLAGFNVAIGQSIVLVANDTTDAIIGTFAGLPPGAFISIPANNGGGGWTISYNGGTGNDVALTRVAAPPVDPTPVLTAVTLGNPDQNGNRSVTVTGKGAPGVSYRVEISVNFQQWTNGSTQTAAAGTGALSFSLTASPPVRAKEFYRIRKL